MDSTDNCSIDRDAQLYRLSQEFLAARRTSATSVQAFAEAHPAFRESILDIFPGLLVVEDMDSLLGNPDRHCPEFIGRYRVLEKIGSGGMGVVYKASHPKLTRLTAIKLLKSLCVRNSQDCEQFLSEAEAASRLNHPNIVPLLEFSDEGEMPFIAMLYVHGFSLDRLQQAQPEDDSGGALVSAGSSLASGVSEFKAEIGFAPGRSFRVIARIGAQVASALAHAHESGMVHRDIKPANLILDYKGNAWVTDFGLAAISGFGHDPARHGSMIGTPRYMAPEQIHGLSDERSDIYSLGLTLYELASGTRVWGAVSDSELATERQHLELPDIREVNPRVPSALADVIMRACAHRVEDRYPNAEELKIVLNRFAHGGITGDRRRIVRRPEKLPFWKRPARLLLSICSVASILTICGLLYSSPGFTDSKGEVRWFVSSQLVTRPDSSGEASSRIAGSPTSTASHDDLEPVPKSAIRF